MLRSFDKPTNKKIVGLNILTCVIICCKIEMVARSEQSIDQGDDMQALMLAAGMGKRLGKFTNNNTKCMVEVAGKKLIDRAIEAVI